MFSRSTCLDKCRFECSLTGSPQEPHGGDLTEDYGWRPSQGSHLPVALCYEIHIARYTGGKTSRSKNLDQACSKI